MALLYEYKDMVGLVWWNIINPHWPPSLIWPEHSSNRLSYGGSSDNQEKYCDAIFDDNNPSIIFQFTEIKIILFLQSNYYKIEATKKCIEEYYKIRANYPDTFDNYDITCKLMKDARQLM